MESKRVEVPSGVLDDICRGQKDDCRGREDDCRGQEDDCRGQEDDCRGQKDDCRGREDDCSPVLDNPPRHKDDCSPILDNPPRHGDDCSPVLDNPPRHRDDCSPVLDNPPRHRDDCSPVLDNPPRHRDDCSPVLDNPPRHRDECSSSPPGRVQRAIKSTKRKRTSICPHCNIEIHSKNMKKHIYRRHAGTADGCSPILDNPPCREQRAIKSTTHSICPHCNIAIHSRNMKKHIYRRHADTAGGCSPIQDNPPRRGDDCSPILDNPPRRAQRAIKSTKITSICPHCNIEIHSKNMKKHIYRRHADTAGGCSPILDNPPEPEDYCRPIQDSPPRLEDDCSPIQDSPPRLEDDCSSIQDSPPRLEDDFSPIQDNPPRRAQRAIKSTTHSICPHCNIEIHSRNMKKHIYRRHAGTAVRDTRADSHHRDAAVPPTASLRAVAPFAQPSGARPTVVETKGPKRTTGEYPEMNGYHKGLLGALDEDEYFFLSLVPACKRMAPRKKAQLKLNIMQMVAQAEFEDTDDGLL